MNKIQLLLVSSLLVGTMQAQSLRERINFDDGWHFAFGHPYDKTKDYNTGTSYFTYLAKARYGADGAAAANFDHRSWRKLNLPHDWAVEVPFDSLGSHSHGYKAVGPGFPDVSAGWYRKRFKVGNEDLGKQIFIDFDGVSRDAKVWVNGHYLGREPSGYQSFSYNISDIINYGAENTVAVRADVSMEEGWYYEGAGIYRHVWLRKTAPLHVPKDGTFVYSQVDHNKALITIETEIENKAHIEHTFLVKNKILNAQGNLVATSIAKDETHLSPMEKTMIKTHIEVLNPELWSVEEPNMHTMITQIITEGKVIDEYHTPFGIRTIKFDADKGFFLNGEHLKLKGTNNHQDHAGVGCAMPDELIRWRLQQLKNFGCNAIRSAHNPPTPELLHLCDEMGMLVINENRLMGTTDNALHELKRLIKRDRNHPSVIVWSVGNEEWGIEWNETGARMTRTMQNYAKQTDPTRPVNVAISGGWGEGSSTTVEIMGYNYLVHGSTDEHHAKFPHQPSIGTEEGSTFTTRGIYEEDNEKHYKTAYDLKPREGWFSIQEGWKHYAERDYLSGMFIWTGFDYRGEPTPYKWPSVTSYFGMMDLCGFPKDNVFYLKSWWQDEPVLHIFPHWNWEGKEGSEIDVWVYSNAEQVELFLNKKSLGKKNMLLNGHLEWKVPYQKGTIKAVSYRNGKKEQETERKTTGSPRQVRMSADKTEFLHKNDVAMITVDVLDNKGRPVPTANNKIHFEIEGAAKIIGLGNGNPTSLEKEVFIENYAQIDLQNVNIKGRNETASLLSALNKDEQKRIQADENIKVCRISFHLDDTPQDNQKYTWYYTHVGALQNIYINGNLIKANVSETETDVALNIDNAVLKKGENTVLIITEPLKPANEWDIPNKTPGVIQVYSPAEKAHRKLFNGLAQVIVKSTGGKENVTLKAYAEGLKAAEITIKAKL